MSTAIKTQNRFEMKIQVNDKKRVLSARPDTIDFRDAMYLPTLVEVPAKKELSEYEKIEVPILDQGSEGACTGFGLATVANYLLRTRKVGKSVKDVSPRMLYDTAKRYDEWPGEEYDGSSARGAMKGWHKHGVCSEVEWPYAGGASDSVLTMKRAQDARNRPLGAYFRVNHKDLVAMHAAITEAGVLYATSMVHEGWSHITDDGIIKQSDKILGGHAFAIVAYDEHGFWIQNSWGEDWGMRGFARISYDDWLVNATDVWVARLGVAVELTTYSGVAASRSAVASQFEAYAFTQLRPHIVSLGNDGELSDQGTYGTSIADVKEIFKNYYPAITKTWKKKRVLLFAHGGLVGENSAIQRLADTREILLDNEIYPISFIWHSDFWSTLQNVVHDALRQLRPEGLKDMAKDFLYDRLDDSLEPVARIPGKLAWDEMKENAMLATTKENGGARLVIEEIDKLFETEQVDEIHIVGHSCGAIYHAPLVQLLATNGAIKHGPMKGEVGKNRIISSCTLWAPACTNELFKDTYLPLISQEKGGIETFNLYTMDDKTEQDDNCADVYHKSLLYLVSHAFEEHLRIPFSSEAKYQGEPLLGMEKFVLGDKIISDLIEGNDRVSWIISPKSPDSDSKSHGGFDNDEETLKSTLESILGAKKLKHEKAELVYRKSERSNKQRTLQLAQCLSPRNYLLS